MKIVSLFGFATWFLGLGTAVGIMIGAAIAPALGPTWAAVASIAAGAAALVIARRAVTLAVRPKPSEQQ